MIVFSALDDRTSTATSPFTHYYKASSSWSTAYLVQRAWLSHELPSRPHHSLQSFEDLEAAAPLYTRSEFWCGVRRGMLDMPTLLFLDANDKQSTLGLHPDDCWEGRQLKFTM